MPPHDPAQTDVPSPPAARSTPGRRRRPVVPSAAPAHLVRSASWAGLRAGEGVRVDGVRQRSARWTFVAHVRNTRTGDEWVEVAGGRPGNHAVRSFRPEQIFPVPNGGPPRKKAPGPSLAEAPRLPL